MEDTLKPKVSGSSQPIGALKKTSMDLKTFLTARRNATERQVGLGNTFKPKGSVSAQSTGALKKTSMDLETFLTARRKSNSVNPKYGAGDANTLVSLHSRIPQGMKASIFNGIRPRGNEISFNQRVAWAKAKQGQLLSASDDDFLLEGAMRHISMSIQDGTRSKYDTALAHFRRFMD
ncbi:MAG: hypothetical protein VXU50_07425, partial [Verrucomicrobiota bacterium]|nr:hypothetical protein [Verrucomicrobiota bacterium]